MRPGTYYPPTDMAGRPSFRTVLRRIAEVWSKQKEDIKLSSKESMARLAEAMAPEVGRFRCWRKGPLPAVGRGVSDRQPFFHHAAASCENICMALFSSPPPQPSAGSLSGAEQGRSIDTCVAQLASRFDAKEGGFGLAPKFPRPAEINVLLHQHARLVAAGEQEAAGERFSTETLGVQVEPCLFCSKQRLHTFMQQGRSRLPACPSASSHTCILPPPPSTPSFPALQPACCTWPPTACARWRQAACTIISVAASIDTRVSGSCCGQAMSGCVARAAVALLLLPAGGHLGPACYAAADAKGLGVSVCQGDADAAPVRVPWRSGRVLARASLREE